VGVAAERGDVVGESGSAERRLVNPRVAMRAVIAAIVSAGARVESGAARGALRLAAQLERRRE
jgi:hypothetical protein